MKKFIEMVGLKTLAGLVVAVVLMVSAFWRIDADLVVQVQTGRIEFRVNPGLNQKRLTDSLFFEKISLEHVGRLSFNSDLLFVADPDQLDWETDTYSEHAWLEFPGKGRTWQFHAIKSGINPTVTLESSEKKGTTVGKLDAILVSQPATVTLELTKSHAVTFTIRTNQEPQRVVLSGLKDLEFVKEGLELEDATHLPFKQDQELTYKALFDNTSGTMTVEGNETNVVLVVNPTRSPENTLFSQTVLPLESVDVSWQDPQTGERGVHPKFQGSIQYPKLPDLPKVVFQSPMFLTIEDLDRFEITSIRIDPANQTFLVEMQGTAGYIKTGTPDNPQDLRPTLFDMIRLHPVLKPLRDLIGLES